ncbi:MAG: septum formation initiator family protein [Coriobacteriales bacterium]|nr:septum formation initiator family protein [Coriobacteriales bacterium]
MATALSHINTTKRNFSPSVRKVDAKVFKNEQKAQKKQFAHANNASKVNNASKASSKPRRIKNKNIKEIRQENKSKAEKKRPSLGDVGVFNFIVSIPIGIKILIASLIVIVLACVILYPSLQIYYKTYRDIQYRESVLAAYNDRNAKVRVDNEVLNTPEGIQDQARRELNYVGSGEQSVSITNVSDYGSYYGGVPNQVDETSINPPNDWYYNILDTIFFVNR